MKIFEVCFVIKFSFSSLLLFLLIGGYNTKQRNMMDKGKETIYIVIHIRDEICSVIFKLIIFSFFTTSEDLREIKII